MKKKDRDTRIDKDNTIDTSPVKTEVYKYPRGNRYNIVYAKTPNNNQHVRRSDEELQKIIDSKPKNWTKKDFLGEGKLNDQKLLTRKETDRKTLKFYQTGKRINMKNIFDNSTEESIREFKKGEIDFETLKNRSSTIKWRSNMSNQERKLYDRKVYENLTEEQLEAKRQRQRDFYEKYLKKN
tara:strand:+ start:481 stop:1026 length:546 start_codon:yes stop_codon:yes gene_type:complete